MGSVHGHVDEPERTNVAMASIGRVDWGKEGLPEAGVLVILYSRF